MESVGKWLLVAAAVLAAAGLAVLVAAKLGWSGRLPGDVVVRRGNWTLYAPIGLSIFLSIVLTIVLNIVLRR